MSRVNPKEKYRTLIEKNADYQIERFEAGAVFRSTVNAKVFTLPESTVDTDTVEAVFEVECVSNTCSVIPFAGDVISYKGVSPIAQIFLNTASDRVQLFCSSAGFWDLVEYTGNPLLDAVPISDYSTTLQQAYEAGAAIVPTVADGDLAVSPVGAISMQLDLTLVTGGADGFRVVDATDLVEIVEDGTGGLNHREIVQSHDIDSVDGYARGDGVPNPLNPDEWSLSSGNLGVGRTCQIDTVHYKHLQTAAPAETLAEWDVNVHNKAVGGKAFVLCASNAIPPHIMRWEVTFAAYGFNAGAAVVYAQTVAQTENSHGDLDRDVTVDGVAGGVAGVVRLRGTGVANDAWSIRLEIEETTVPTV